MEKFYVTTPIYYTNSDPHVGSAYTTIAADVLARWHRLKSEDVFFLTGTDEHGQKIQETAESKNINPKIFVDKIAKKFQDVFKLLNISNDYFIRTTNKNHEKEVQRILQELYDKKYIYKGHYESYYCVGCEQYLTESDLVDGKCPLHKIEPELRKEEAYLFKLSKFQNQLLKLIKSGKYCILPENRRKEIITFLESGLKDISISRLKEKIYWGVELPFDKNHTCFVWVDAFWNYLTGLKEKNKFNEFWPPDIQLMAKDILRVHATIWPALLLATGNKLPKTLFIHGYFTVNGQKMSKSLGNVVSPEVLVKNYRADPLRYLLLREIPFGSDGDFSEDVLISRNNNELANDLGNLVSRILTLVEKNFPNGLSSTTLDKKLTSKLNIKNVDNYMKKIEIHNALSEIWKFINECNKYINENKIWELKEEKLQKHLYTLLESIRVLSVLLSPFLPDTSEKINKQLNVKPGNLRECKFGLIKNYNVKKSEVLFEKLEKQSKEVPKMTKFTDLDLRVGKITAVKDHPDADKLYILLVDLGEFDHDLQIVSGLKLAYKKEELMNKKIVVVYNLENSIIRGIESNAMLLAVEDDKGTLALLTAKKSLLGSKVYTNQPNIKEAKTITYNQFKSIKISTKNNKVYYKELPLKTDKEDIFLDKDMPNSLIVE